MECKREPVLLCICVKKQKCGRKVGIIKGKKVKKRKGRKGNCKMGTSGN